LKNWKQKILDIIAGEPDERKVYWFWEPVGNTGKSFLVKYIDWKYDAIIANGKQSDIFHQYRTFIEEKDDLPTIALIDIPRSHENYVCYSTLEKIKDGLMHSGKYEGGKVRVLEHHLIVFANFLPKESTLSADRWEIVKISI